MTSHRDRAPDCPFCSPDPARVFLGPVPAAGEERAITREEVRAALRRAGLEASVTGAEACRARAGVPVPEGSFAGAKIYDFQYRFNKTAADAVGQALGGTL